MSSVRDSRPATPAPGPWQVLLQDELAERAASVVDEIAAELRTFLDLPYPDTFSTPLPPEVKQAEEATLSRGDAGLALFFAYRSLSGRGEGEDEIARRFLERAMDTIAQVPSRPSLYSGFSGIAWTIAHLDGKLDAPQKEDPVAAVDEALLPLLSASPWQGEYDLIGGLVGYGVYAAERIPRPSAVACLEAIVQRLAELAERTADGVTWFTSPVQLPEHQREQFPDGYYNLGVAHGVPGVISLLATACAAGVAVTAARELLDGAMSWLQTQQLPPDSGSRFTTMTYPGIEPSPSRLAWCYGDPGIAATVLQAARYAGEPAWEEFALEIALGAAACPVDKAGVVDAPLCHGAAGLGHLFNRLYQATGEERLAEAARFWFEHVFGLRRPGQGVAGFGSQEQERWVPSAGLLTGATGIGLALLGATTSCEPAWDRFMLLAVPPRFS